MFNQTIEARQRDRKSGTFSIQIENYNFDILL